MTYITRELERKFLKLNDFFKVLLVTGARQVGKTTMLKHLAGSDRTYVTMDNTMARDLKTGDFDSVAAELPEHWFDRIMLDMLDPWNRLEQAYRVIAPGGVLVSYVTTTTQMSRMAEALRAAGCWTEPQIQESFERTWKAQGLAVRPDHQMIGHTGFLVISRAMASGFEALRKRDRVTKDTQTDIDSLTDEQREAQIEELELRDISDHKLRKVLRDLDRQVGELGNTHE